VKPAAWWTRGAWLARWLVCQYLVLLGWILFRNQNFHNMLYCVRKFVLFDFSLHLTNLGLGNVNIFLLMIVVFAFLILHSVSYRLAGIANTLDRLGRWPLMAVYSCSVAGLIALWPNVETAFIYFQF
jgi:hypothetical protein